MKEGQVYYLARPDAVSRTLSEGHGYIWLFEAASAVHPDLWVICKSVATGHLVSFSLLELTPLEQDP
jgi:hypothetical protein